MEVLIEELELEFWGTEKIYPPPEDVSTDTETEKKPQYNDMNSAVSD